MQFVLPEATRKRDKYYPRHFKVVSDYFSDIHWADSPQSVQTGQWSIVVRSPGYQGLGRETARKYGIDSAFDLLSPEEVDAIKQRRGNIILDLGWEMLNPAPSVVKSLAQTMDELELDPTRVFIFHSNQNARDQFSRNWIEETGSPPPSSLEFPVAMALCVVHHQKNRDDRRIIDRREQSLRRTTDGSRSRLFNSFNGEVRPHRLYVAAALESLGILDRGYFSLLYPRKSAKESDQEFRARSLKIVGKLPRGNEFQEAAGSILARLPMGLDLGGLPSGGVEQIAWVSQDPSYYDDSRFSLVIDTSVSDSDSLFVTEKVLKPIMNHSPFLLVGSSGGANLLRSYGFQTFEPHIRQCETGSYEEVVHCAVEELERLSRLSESELDALSRALTEACDHNAAQFWNSFPAILRHKLEQCLLALGPQAAASAARSQTR